MEPLRLVFQQQAGGLAYLLDLPPDDQQEAAIQTRAKDEHKALAFITLG